MAAPQYSQAPPQQQPNYGSQTQAISHQFSSQTFAPQPIFQQPIATTHQTQQQQSPHVSAEEWAALNPLNGNIEDIQREWETFLTYVLINSFV